MWSGEEDSNLRPRGSEPRVLGLAGPSPEGTLARTRTSMTPGNSRLPYRLGDKGMVPEGRNRTSDRLGVNQLLCH